MELSAQSVVSIAHEEGFELAGIAPATAHPDFERYQNWAGLGHAGRMSYLTDHRAEVRGDPSRILPGVRSMLCVGKLYNTAYAANRGDGDAGWISRYAWGDDYHDTIRARLQRVEARVRGLAGAADCATRICVDTAPLLERSYAKLAGLGWIGKNTCLINQRSGSWFLLGEMLLSADLIDAGAPPALAPNRCGSCTRCIDACPTDALIPAGDGAFQLDARRCISYFTIELKGTVPEEHRAAIGNHVFGCDICQDVCPWNRRAPVTSDAEFQPRDGMHAADLERLAFATPEAFRLSFRASPVSRARHSGFLRNVAIAMGNSGNRERFAGPLKAMLVHTEDEVLREHIRWALSRLSD